MSVRRVLILIALICEILAALPLGLDLGVALVPLGLAFYFAAEAL